MNIFIFLDSQSNCKSHKLEKENRSLQKKYKERRESKRSLSSKSKGQLKLTSDSTRYRKTSLTSTSDSVSPKWNVGSKKKREKSIYNTEEVQFIFKPLIVPTPIASSSKNNKFSPSSSSSSTVSLTSIDGKNGDALKEKSRRKNFSISKSIRLLLESMIKMHEKLDELIEIIKK